MLTIAIAAVDRHANCSEAHLTGLLWLLSAACLSAFAFAAVGGSKVLVAIFADHIAPLPLHLCLLAVRQQCNN